ncbi:MAG: hypothetical protein LUE63_04475 [Lachnospiraceae bacterium]|nr:hypothetical protein [Lachnospiraceae bacterium]
MSVARSRGYTDDDLSDAIQHLENQFPLPSDKVTAEFGGELQYHLRDFAHHPTLAGLAFSILSQFTKCSYGTNAKDEFIKFSIPDGDYLG